MQRRDDLRDGAFFCTQENLLGQIRCRGMRDCVVRVNDVEPFRLASAMTYCGSRNKGYAGVCTR